jgi:hypothetical protein
MTAATLAKRGLFFAVFALFAVFAWPASAQNWDFDARTIGLGGVSGSGTIASGMIEHGAGYRSIVLPFGLLQVLPDLEIYDPDSTRFDPVRAVEHAASPIHFIVGRDDDLGDGAFATTIATARFYADPANSGASLATRLDLGGIVAPSWGITIPLPSGRADRFQGIYVGAGPYVTVRGSADLDPRVLAFIGGTPVDFPSGPLTIISTRSEEQGALAITGGYRGYFSWGPDAATSRDGLYVAMNYNYLIGFGYLDDTLAVRVGPADVVIDRVSSSSGRGMAVDVGAGAVEGHWEVGAGVNGIGSRIRWTDVSQRPLGHGTLVTGGLLGDPGVPSPHADVEVSLPIDVRGNLAYRADGWMAVGEVGHGVAGTLAHAGLERRVLPRLDVRGGLSYSFGGWNPTGGVGVAVNRRVAIDFAAFATNANFQRQRQLALAASIRLMR